MSDTTHTQIADAGQASHAAHAKHVNPWLIFAILAAFTVFEISVTLLGIPKATITPVLIAIALVKAGLVAAYYMHLRYEKVLLTIIFVSPTLMALLLITILMSA